MVRRLLVLLLLAAVAYLALGGDGPKARDGRVLRVVDGDTLHVRAGGRDETVRVVGIDTPERGACGFDAATRALRSLVDGRRVDLVRDPSQDRRDRYGRLLAYVEAGGEDVGLSLVRGGWADVYVFGDDPFRRVGRYQRALERARADGRGAHGRC